MSTEGTVLRYRLSAYAAHVAPLAGAVRTRVEEALFAIIPRDELDGDTRDRLAHGSTEETLALLFAAACVAPDAEDVGLGKFRTLTTLPAPTSLRRLLKAWEAHPSSLRHDELHVSPAPRALLEEIHAARPTGGEGDDLALTQLLDFVAATLADPDASLVYAYPWLHVPTRERAPVALAWEDAAKQELARAGLPIWDVRDVTEWKEPPAPIWIWQLEAHRERVPHVTVEGDGTRVHFIPEAPSFWRRLFEIQPRRGHRFVKGPCADSGCRLCRAAGVVLGYVEAGTKSPATPR